MHDLQSAPASLPLRSFVRAYAQRDLDVVGADLVQPIPASLEHILQFEFFDPLQIQYPDGRCVPTRRIDVVGPHTRPGINVQLGGRIQSFAVFFQPFGMWQLFRVPANELVDTSFSASDVLGSGIEHLWDRLADCASFKERVAAAEAYLRARAANVSTRSSMMNVASRLFRNGGTDRIDQLAADSALSVRQFERRFAGETGISPKLFARITRFQTAVDAKLAAPNQTWLTIAHDLGYHDQMHMIRDFHRLGGASPNQMLSALGDIRPPALAASEGEHHESITKRGLHARSAEL